VKTLVEVTMCLVLVGLTLLALLVLLVIQRC